MPTPCYWLSGTGEAHVTLRRFTFHDDEHCPAADGPWGHDAVSGIVGVVPWPVDGSSTGAHILPGGPWQKEHAAWPLVCGRCNAYEFKVGDQWQVQQHQLFVRHDTNERTTLPGATPGAMFDSKWYPGCPVGPDGIALTVRLPNGMDWRPDGPATGGGSWVRTGDPRQPATLSITPSIAAGKPGSHEYYHGHLTAGVLTDHMG